MSSLNDLLKYNPVSVAIYEKIVSSRSRDVEAYIFMATTGRSGSKSLTSVFEAADNAVCYHEPYPIMFSHFPEFPDQPRGTDREKYFRDLFYRKKRINIKRNAIGYRYYVETNHQFIKNFAKYAIEYFGDKIRILHVYRDPIKVASSFYSIESIPDTTPRGMVYAIDPKDPDNLIKMSDLLYNNKEFEHPLYKNLWYWYELHSRVKQYKKKYPDISWHTMNTDDLNNRKKLIEMFNAIGVEYDKDKLDSLVGTRDNVVPHMKKQAIDPDEARSMHDKLLAKMIERYGENFWVS
jgi:hypothetical protein